tara:strand:- start:440 stop:595 length:156 start_codon:yes stop_codon:yes gene_type:complete
MNAMQKKRMFTHYEELGWSQREIVAYGTVDLTGEKPSESKKKVSKKESKKD